MLSLEECLELFDVTPKQRAELSAEPERALGWFEWASKNGVGIGLVLNKYRSGATAPDADAFYEQSPQAGPNYGKLLRTCTQLVENTGHEYLKDDLRAEFVRLGNASKVGNGARLSEDDESRLLARGDDLRTRWEALEPERQAARDKWKKQYDERFKHQRKTLKELDAAP